MLNYIWGAIMLVSVACALMTGRMAELSNSIFCGATDAVNLVISLLGMMCLWTGLMKIAEHGGLTTILSRIFYPILSKIFTEYDKDSKAMKAICMNVTANLLGLGNAATPMGIQAMKEIQKCNKNKTTATNGMVMFVVMNTASIQIIPTFMSILRQKHGSNAPFDILPAIWIVSFLALIIGITIAKILERKDNTNE